MRSLEQQIASNQQKGESPKAKEHQNNLAKLNNELNLYKQIFGLSINLNHQTKSETDVPNSFSIRQDVGDHQILLVPNVKVEQLNKKPQQLSFDGVRKMTHKVKEYQRELIAGLQH